MIRKTLCLALFPLLLALGCSSTPDKPETPTPEDQEGPKGKLVPLSVKEKRKALGRVILDINSAQVQLQKFGLEGSRTSVRRKIDELTRYLRDITSKYLPELLDRLAEGNEFHRTITAWAVGWPREEVAIQPLINALRDPSDQVVKAACLGLKEMALPSVPTQPLIEVVDHSADPGCRSNAVLALSSLARFKQGDKQLKKRFLGWLEHTDARVRLHSLLGLRSMVNEDDVVHLAPLTEDPKPAVRRVLALVLWRTGSPRALPSLLELVSKREPNRNVRLFARKALSALAGGTDAGQDEGGWRKIFARELQQLKMAGPKGR